MLKLSLFALLKKEIQRTPLFKMQFTEINGRLFSKNKNPEIDWFLNVVVCEN